MPVNLIEHEQSGTTRFRLNRKVLLARTEQLLDLLDQSNRPVSIVLLDDQEMAWYNQTYRHRQGPTNVLSFPAPASETDFPACPAAELAADELGDILISVETARKEAEEKNISLHQRITELVVHGLLHLLGHDHELSAEQAALMFNTEEQLLRSIHPPGRKTMPHLAINVDHIATIREARGGAEPDPVLAAGICELAGARGIVVHLREDRRHIQDRDVRLLRQTVKTKLNLEMAAAKEIIDFALEIKPDMVTLVPEKRKELTTEGGLDVISNAKKLAKAIGSMTDAGIPVSIFINPDADQIKVALELGATYVELHTGRYCEAKNQKEQEQEFRLIEQAGELAYESGLRVNAGHGLDYRTVARIAALPTIEELSIGHAIIARAAFIGLDQAVREMQACIDMAFC